MNRRPLFCAQQVGVDVDGRSLLRGVDFALESGEVLAIVGPSGCGKTRLLRALVGLDDLGAGQLSLDGQSPDSIGWPAFRRRVLLVPTESPLFPGTVRDNLTEPVLYRSRRSTAPVVGVEQLLDEVGLAGILDRDVATLSSGEQRRVAIIRGVAFKPDVLIVDEPTNGLDEDQVAVVEHILARRADLIVVSHNLAFVERVAGKTIDLLAHRPTAMPAPHPTQTGTNSHG